MLTGTPLENRLEELHSIVEFVDRFRLGPAFRFLHNHQHLDETGRVVGYRNLTQIGKTLAPILLRRTKGEVLKELPERLDKRLFVPMTPQQQAYHDENRDNAALIVSKWRRYGFLSDSDQQRLMIALQNMRMSCNSTYLLDPTTDHGVKADELMDQMSDTLEEPDAKAVIFSQWVRTHELIQRRMDRRGWKYVLFHGGVPGPRRQGLIDRFKQEPRCRFFLSTDAGGVGLNLQNANVVVNMDQPWNPAVLEQRIGRVHRLGQQRPVRVVHFISKGTIEEGMLGLIDFKKSLFAGALDGGQEEVFLGGTRLKRFMESVEKATGGITQPMPVQEPEAEATGTSPGDIGRPVEAGSPAPRSAADPWTDIAAAGLSLIEKFTAAVRAGPMAPGSDPLSRLVTRDEKTGQTYLKLPVPRPDVLQQITGLLQSLLGKG